MYGNFIGRDIPAANYMIVEDIPYRKKKPKLDKLWEMDNFYGCE